MPRRSCTIRGEDRNTVVFDGQDQRANAIDVEADGVTLENMSAHNFTANGFYWDGVEGFAGRYLTVWNVGLYGIYAISSRGERIDLSGDWTTNDPEMVAITRHDHGEVTIVVRRPGESNLTVFAGGESKVLRVRARHSDDAMAVEITQ